MAAEARCWTTVLLRWFLANPTSMEVCVPSQRHLSGQNHTDKTEPWPRVFLIGALAKAGLERVRLVLLRPRDAHTDTLQAAARATATPSTGTGRTRTPWLTARRACRLSSRPSHAWRCCDSERVRCRHALRNDDSGRSGWFGHVGASATGCSCPPSEIAILCHEQHFRVGRPAVSGGGPA